MLTPRKAVANTDVGMETFDDIFQMDLMVNTFDYSCSDILHKQPINAKQKRRPHQLVFILYKIGYKRDMHIVQLLPELNQGGVERGTVELNRELVKRGHQSSVISLGGEQVSSIMQDGGNHYTLDVGSKPA